MKKYLLFTLILSSLFIKAQTLLLVDDFKSGAFTLSETAVFDSKNQSGPYYQSGFSIMGGTRKVIYSRGPNPYNQKMSTSVLTKLGAFVVSSGYKAMSSIEITYGLNSKNQSNNTHIDLTQYKNFNIEFDGINHLLNFNIVFFCYPNSAQCIGGENFSNHDSPFVFTIPINKLMANPQPTFNPKDVGSFSLLFNAASATWGGSLAVKRIWFD